MNEGTHSCCGHKKSSKKIWYKNGLLWVFLLTVLLLGASFAFISLVSFRQTFFDYTAMMFWPILAGFFVGGFIDHFVPKEYISKHLAVPKRRTIFYAVGLGFLMSACCHGILAICMELHKKGASGPAVVSFLLASPWANLPITILLFGFFGAKAFLIVFGALGVALITGFSLQGLGHIHWIEQNPHSVSVEAGFSIRRDIAARFRNFKMNRQNLFEMTRGVWFGMIDLAQMVLPWVLIGILLAGLVTSFVPNHVFHHYFGPTFLGLLVTIALATFLEVCSEGTSPLAFTIYRQTGAFGNAFAFLMGGVITDVTEISLIWKNLGPKTAIWMLAISLPQVILLGWLFNRF
ncbi:MAG TPA: permease [Candidatus Omnitrophota bacterium]|nr:permease [Candidatus Omnitrophota bacterium]